MSGGVNRESFSSPRIGRTQSRNAVIVVRVFPAPVMVDSKIPGVVPSSTLVASASVSDLHPRPPGPLSSGRNARGRYSCLPASSGKKNLTRARPR